MSDRTEADFNPNPEPRITRDELKELIAWTSHQSWLKGKTGNPEMPDPNDHDRERAEDIIIVLERLEMFPFVNLKASRDELKTVIAEVSHRTWLKQRARDKGIAGTEKDAATGPDDRSRAEGIVRELENRGLQTYKNN